MATIRTLLTEAASLSPNHVAVQWKANRVWSRWTFAELQSCARVAAEVFGRLGVRPGDRVALMSENRPEWMAVYLGAACCGIVVVPIDVKMRPVEVAHVMRDSEASVFVGSAGAWRVLRGVQQKMPDLRTAAMFDGVVEKDFREGRTRYLDFERLFKEAAPDAAGPDAFYDRHAPEEDDLASIIYTSGTTGRSKGAMLTHGNFLAQMNALEYFTVREDDNFLLVLPLHHAFAFTANFLVPLKVRCEISIVESIRTVGENMRESGASILIAVPLLAEKILASVQRRLKGSVTARFLMGIGLSRLVGRRVVKALGGRLRIIICGAAPCDAEMLRTWTRLGVRAFEGYGLTESAPIAALNPERDAKFGTVGYALPGHEIRIADAGEDGVGEIELHGPSVMKGYFRNEEATAESFDGEWLRTGDLGRMDDSGRLTITGRKKCLIVNREGKNIYPEEVEQAVRLACPHVLEILVLGYHVAGEAKGEHVGAIVVPDTDKLTREHGGVEPTADEAKAVALGELREALKSLATYKHPRRVRVRFEPFQKTNTLKIKRFLYSLDTEEELGPPDGAAADA